MSHCHCNLIRKKEKKTQKSASFRSVKYTNTRRINKERNNIKFMYVRTGCTICEEIKNNNNKEKKELLKKKKKY